MDNGNAWNPWTNPEIVLFHGTLLKHAQDILSRGIDLSQGRSQTDFGRGFYTTTWRTQAEIWSEELSDRNDGEPSAVIRITISREALSSLSSIVFIRGSMDAIDFWRFVQHCRRQMPHIPQTRGYYDIAYGPVAKAWFGPRNSRLAPGYDQVSFHTPRAQQMLNDMCQVEVL
jgi:hypothetical protein